MKPILPRHVWSIRRANILRSTANRSSKILEIGPLFRPITPRSEGFNSYSLDVTSDIELKRIYAHTGEAHKIAPVDFIKKQSGLACSIPVEHHGSFDLIIASHVLEHVPNPISFLQDCALLLKKGGTLTLALPDKRYCFDALRPITLTGGWIEAYREERKEHSWRAIFESSTYSTARNGRIAWPIRLPFSPLTFVGKALADGYRDAAGARDCHAWVFTPASFALIAQECHALGLIELSTAFVSKTRRGEFFAHLRAQDQAPIDHHGRMKLMMMSARER